MIDFAKFKKSSGLSLEKLNSKIKEMNTREGDARFWQLTTDKGGVGQAVFRFLPVPDPDEVPFVRVWDHGFKGPGGWYIENSLTTIQQDDPVSEMNTTLWETGTKENKGFVSGTEGPDGKWRPGSKRRLHYISYIYMINDSGNAANNGKVFLYKYGKKVFEKLNGAMNPKFAEDTAMNPFDMWEGANFILRATKEDGQRSYADSKFEAPSRLAKTDALIEEIWKQTASLKEFTDPKNFKTYEELKAKLARVMKTKVSPTATVEEAPALAAKPTQQRAAASVGEEKSPPWENLDDGDDELASFRKMAQ